MDRRAGLTWSSIGPFEGIEAVGRVLRKALDVNLSGCSVPPAAGPRPTCRIPLLDRAMQGNDGRSSTASPIASLSVRQRKGKCKGSNGCAADQTIEAPAVWRAHRRSGAGRAYPSWCKPDCRAIFAVDLARSGNGWPQPRESRSWSGVVSETSRSNAIKIRAEVPGGAGKGVAPYFIRVDCNAIFSTHYRHVS